MFIKKNRDKLSKAITAGPVYRPPYYNNNNYNIENFQKFKLVIDKFSKNKSRVGVFSDFNTVLLEIDEKEI